VEQSARVAPAQAAISADYLWFVTQHF